MKTSVKYMMGLVVVLLSMSLVSCQKSASVSGSKDYYAGNRAGVEKAEAVGASYMCTRRFDAKPFIDRSTWDQISQLKAEGRSEGFVKGFEWGYRDTLTHQIANKCTYYMN